MFNKENFLTEFNTQGFSIIKNVVSADFAKKMGEDMLKAIEKENEYHDTDKYRDYGVILMAAMYGGTFLDIYDNEKFIQPFEAILGTECITYTLTSSCIPPQQEIYTSRIHVDYPRIIPNFNTAVVGQLIVDDFTTKSGATWLLPHSQILENKPSKEYFYQNAVRLIAKAGDVCYFHPRLWHAGAVNQSDSWRRCLLLGMVRPWMKQRLDIPRILQATDIDLSKLSDKALQKLGFHSQVPASYDEYFMPLEKRKFKQRVV